MPIFVVQEHLASHLHWDFRLEMNRVSKSWAIPKGPSLDPHAKRLAIRVPDHDREHANYEGIIPEGSYGAGPVLIWDKGEYEMLEPADPVEGLENGDLKFRLKGKILKGNFELVKMHGPGREKAWLLIKKKDQYAIEGWKTPVLLTPSRKTKLKETPPSCSFKEG